MTQDEREGHGRARLSAGKENASGANSEGNASMLEGDVSGASPPPLTLIEWEERESDLVDEWTARVEAAEREMVAAQRATRADRERAELAEARGQVYLAKEAVLRAALTDAFSEFRRLWAGIQDFKLSTPTSIERSADRLGKELEAALSDTTPSQLLEACRRMLEVVNAHCEWTNPEEVAKAHDALRALVGTGPRVQNPTIAQTSSIADNGGAAR